MSKTKLLPNKILETVTQKGIGKTNQMYRYLEIMCWYSASLQIKSDNLDLAFHENLTPSAPKSKYLANSNQTHK